jgi:4-hydroxy-tetrahydrodipicolinate reductase
LHLNIENKMTALKIGLLGYGKMGKAIESVAEAKGLEIVWRISRSNAAMRTPALLQTADVVIEFSRPEVAYEQVMACLAAGVPVVSGTTGWLDDLPKAKAYCVQQNGALLWASNFSVGVNLFFELNLLLARLMKTRPEYRPDLTETHHVHKLDAPSGTAVSLAEDLLQAVGRLQTWALTDKSATAPGVLPIHAIREGEVPGTHTLRWTSAIDEITIEHRADSRLGFAQGAVLAAAWLADKKGVFGMKDVLGIPDFKTGA